MQTETAKPFGTFWMIIGASVIGLVILSILYILVIDYIKKKTQPEVASVVNETTCQQEPVVISVCPFECPVKPQETEKPEPVKIEPVKIPEQMPHDLKIDLQDSIKKVETEITARIESIENANVEIKILIDELKNKSNVLSSEIVMVKSEVVEVKKDVIERDRKTNERINVLVQEFELIVAEIKRLNVQVEKHEEHIKILYKTLEEHKKMIEENKKQIEDMKLMFYNYDTVLAIEKAKKK